MKSKINLGILKVFTFCNDEGTRMAHLDYIDREGKLITFKSFIGIQAKEGEPVLETWDTEEKDLYELNITNKQN